jgi:hypothetical protein
MSTPLHARFPASARHAFALAFDLAVRRDPIHSILVPVVLRSPWIVALALLPPPDRADRPGQVMLLTSIALVGDWIMVILIGGMLRFRARSVFGAPRGSRPAPVLDCYASGIGRMPWLMVTEIARNLALLFAAFFFVLPVFFLGQRLAFATEAVVLDERHLTGALDRSWRLSRGRFERWLEMIVASVVVALLVIFAVAALSLVVTGPGISTWVAVTWLALSAVMGVIQYAWTFLYLRLVEVESPGIEVGPMYALEPGATPPVGLAVGAPADGMGVAFAEPPRVASGSGAAPMPDFVTAESSGEPPADRGAEA